MFLIALAATLSAPAPHASWFNREDTPVGWLRGAVVTVDLAITVAPDGRVQECSIEGSSGNGKIDQYTCALTLKRAQFRPAQSAEGYAAYGVFRMFVTWASPGMSVSRRPYRGSGAITYDLGPPPA